MVDPKIMLDFSTARESYFCAVCREWFEITEDPDEPGMFNPPALTLDNEPVCGKCERRGKMLTWILSRISSWTHAHATSHLRDEFGDEAVDDLEEHLKRIGVKFPGRD
jgi:hypothetical protein